MNSKDFVKKLGLMKLSVEDFAGLGLSKKYIQKTIKSFTLEKIGDYKEDNEILNLMFNYNLSNLDLLPFDFLEDPLEDDEFILFASFEYEALAIEKKTGKVKFIHGEGNPIIEDAAKDEMAFFDVIHKIISDYVFSKKNKIEIDSCAQAIELMNLSKSPGSANFYNWMVGCFE